MPNLLYILADQLRPQSCGYMGDNRARTPNIDRLSSEGINFVNATSVYPVCSPHRASLFTGCYPTTNGYVMNELGARTDLPTLAGTLTQNGVNCAYIGKWHIYATEGKVYKQAGDFHKNPANQFVPPGPHRLGFDHYWAAYNFNHSYYKGFYYEDKFERIDIPAYEPDAMTDLAISYLENASENPNPFALFVSYGTPHQPWNWDNVPEEWGMHFKDMAFDLPPNYQDGSGEYWHAWFDRDWWMKSVKPNLIEWQRIYAAMTANLDWNVGRILDAIDKFNLAHDTLVVFTSDHGEMFGAHGRVQKNIYYEEAARVPFLMRWPNRIAPKTESDACLNTPDIMPTLLSLIDVDIPDGIDGFDLSHCVFGQHGKEPEAAFLQGMGPSVDWDDGFEWRALRDKQYTYAIEKHRESLYNHREDPLQLHNLANNPDQARTIQHYRDQIRTRMDALNDTFEPITFYRDHWIENGRVIRGARD